MTRAQARLDQVVLTAAGLDTQERTTYLRRLHQEDPELIDEARRLLVAAVEVSDSFLADPALDILGVTRPELGGGAPDDEAAAAEAPISPEERYALGPRIGRGGMAEVFQAQDRQLDRTVALKLLNAKDPVSLSRCLREARIQARIRHPHVLDVYDTGEWNGRPFIALRWVEGPTLGELAESSPLEEQVALLIQVADGLDAAHRKGLIHRDVKPSNVLVEEVEGELTAFVGDFGIAMPAVEDEGGPDVVGTLPYLAPERLDATARADRRSDIWSFGVMMYELLTGALPFQGARMLEQLHGIRHEAPLAPRDRVPNLPVDLEAVILKCLAKDPAERYAGAHEVAADLRRFLEGDVVEAYAAGLAYRITRFGLRHRGWVVFAAVAAVMLMIALAVAAVLGRQAVYSDHQASVRQGQAEDLISFMLLDLRDKLDALGRLELIDEVGAKALRYFAAVQASDLSNDELARYSTALHQIGDVRMRRGELASAVEAFEQSQELAREALTREPHNQEHIFTLGQSHFWVGYGLREQGDLDGAQRAFEAYLDLSQRWVAADPGAPRRLLELSYALSNLGTLHEDRGELEAARERFEASLEIKKRLATRAPEDLELQSELAWTFNSLGVVTSALGEPIARRYFAAELEIRQSLVAAAPQDARWQDHLATTHNYLGLWQLRYGFWRDAADHFERAEELYAGLVVEDTANYQRRRRQAMNRTALGRTRSALGDSETGLRWLELALQTFESPEASGTAFDRREKASALFQLARLKATADDELESWARLDVVVTLFEGVIAEAPEDRLARERLATALLLRGDLHRQGGRDDEARREWLRAYELSDRFTEVTGGRRLTAPLALALLRLGDRQGASPLLMSLEEEGICDPAYPDLCFRSEGKRAG